MGSQWLLYNKIRDQSLIFISNIDSEQVELIMLTVCRLHFCHSLQAHPPNPSQLDRTHLQDSATTGKLKNTHADCAADSASQEKKRKRCRKKEGKSNNIDGIYLRPYIDIMSPLADASGGHEDQNKLFPSPSPFSPSILVFFQAWLGTQLGTKVKGRKEVLNDREVAGARDASCWLWSLLSFFENAEISSPSDFGQPTKLSLIEN